MNSALSYITTLAGPFISYCFCTLLLLQSSNEQKNKLGIAFLFATVPFARIFTACMGGGDEKTVLVYLLGDHLSPFHKIAGSGNR